MFFFQKKNQKTFARLGFGQIVKDARGIASTRRTTSAWIRPFRPAYV
jgi:hypothetical protein